MSDPSTISPIREDMSIDQGYNVNLKRPAKFGYVHSIFTPFMRLPPDQDINQGEEDVSDSYYTKVPHVPDKAFIVLSQFKYDNPTEPLIFTGRVSTRTAGFASGLKADYPMTFKFATFDFDHAAGQWYEHIVSGSKYPHASELTGRIQQVRMNGRYIELVVSPLEGLVQNIGVAENVKHGSIDVGWGPASRLCSECGNVQCNCQSILTQTTLLQDLVF